MLNQETILNEKNWVVNKYSKPYPFAQIDNFIDQITYNKLVEVFPSLQDFLDLPGIKESIPEHGNYIAKMPFAIINNDKTSPWFEIGSYFVSQKFFYRMCELYADDLNAYYPDLYEKVKAKSIKLGIAGFDNISDVDVLLDFQLGVNTPVKSLSTARGPHLDNRNVLYVGLCYFKDDDDPTNTGHYTAYQLKPTKKLRLGPRRSVKLSDVTEFAQVKYDKNRLATFMNTIDSIHGVSQREITEYCRKFFVFNAVVNQNLYQVDPGFTDRVMKRVKNIFNM
ncbi:MAG: hypothetical protein OEZ39_09520 [Gammaproteobacteria bacterium]|nr:hypothetical protein [Gammaproteobacteria bacterium]